MHDLGLTALDATTLCAAGKTVMFVAVDGADAGLIAVTDPVKPGAAQAISALMSCGQRIILATCDFADTAKTIARALGTAEVHAALLPGTKSALNGIFRGRKLALGDHDQHSEKPDFFVCLEHRRHILHRRHPVSVHRPDGVAKDRRLAPATRPRHHQRPAFQGVAALAPRPAFITTRRNGAMPYNPSNAAARRSRNPCACTIEARFSASIPMTRTSTSR